MPEQISGGWVVFQKMDGYIHNQFKTTVTFVNSVKHPYPEKDISPQSLI